MKIGIILLTLLFLALTSFSSFADLPNAIIEPSNPRDSDNLFCYVDVPETRPFADFRWFVDNVETTTGVSVRDDGSHLNNAQSNVGDRVRCEATIVYGPSLPNVPTNPSEVTILADEPVLTADIYTSSTSVSVGGSVAFNGRGSTGDIVSYSWDFGDGETAEGIAVSHIFEEAGEYTVTLTVSDGTDTDTDSVDINVEFEGILVEITSPADGDYVSSSSPVNFISSVTYTGESTLEYLWDFGDGETSNEASPSHTYERGIYSVRLTVTDGVSTGEDEITLFVRESYTPLLNIDNLEVYSDLFTTTERDFLRGQDIYVKFTVNDVISGEGISDLTEHLEVVVRDDSGMIAELTPYSGPTSDSVAGVYYYSGQFPLGDAHLGRNDVRAYIPAPRGGVLDQDSVPVRGHNNVPVANAGGDTSAAANTETVLDGSLSSDVEDLDSELRFMWIFEDGSTEEGLTITHVFDNIGEEEVTLRVRDTENAFSEDTITVNVLEGPDVEITNPSEGALVLQYSEGVYFRADVSSPSNPLGHGLEYLWDFGDGETSNEISPRHSYEDDGRYTASLTVDDNGLIVSDEVTFYVFVQPIIEPVTPPYLAVGNVQTYKNLFRGSEDEFLRDSKIFVKFKVKDQNGDGREGLVDKLKVYAGDGEVFALTPFTGSFRGLMGEFLNVNNGQLCVGLFGRCSVQIMDGVYYYAGRIPLDDSYLGTNEVTVKLDVDDVFPELKVASKNILIKNNIPVADIAGDSEIYVLHGDEVVFDGSTTRDVEDSNTDMDFVWDFGDDSNANGIDVVHTYDDSESYEVSLQVTDTEGDSSISKITVNVLEPTVDIVNPLDGEIFLIGEDVQFNVNAENFDLDHIDYNWNFGDVVGAGSDEANPSHSYVLPGEYEVKVVVTDGVRTLEDSVLISVVIPPEPTVNILTPSDGETFLVDDEVVYSADVNFFSDAPLSYLWSFGDGETSNEVNPRHEYSTHGEYVITLAVSNSGRTIRDSVTINVKFEDESTAIIVSPLEDQEFVIGENVNFESEIENFDLDNVDYKWNFGDGSFSNEANTRHSYILPGEYVVKLKVSDNVVTVSDTVSIKVVLPRVTPVVLDAVIKISNANPEFNEEVIFDGSLSEGNIETYNWDFGDGIEEEGANVKHTYFEPGEYEATLTVSDNAGNSNSESVLVTVNDVDRGPDFDKATRNNGHNEDEYNEFSISSLRNLNSKSKYNKGDVIKFLVNVDNRGNIAESLTLRAGIEGVNLYSDIQTIHLQHGSNVARFVNVRIPNNIESGTYLVKMVLTNNNGAQNTKYWQFEVA